MPKQPSQSKSPRRKNQLSHARDAERLVSVKQLEFELGIKPRAIRLLLRARYKGHPQSKPWQWRESEAEKVRNYLRRVLCLPRGGRDGS
jgi:hypothetical protein